MFGISRRLVNKTGLEWLRIDFTNKMFYNKFIRRLFGIKDKKGKGRKNEYTEKEISRFKTCDL